MTKFVVRDESVYDAMKYVDLCLVINEGVMT